MLPCSFCTKCFDRPSLLNRHLRTHTGERPHACEICNKAFSTSSSLNTHRRIHSGEKPHECGVCGKKFTASSNLYYHRMTHVKVCKVDWNHSYIDWIIRSLISIMINLSSTNIPHNSNKKYNINRKWKLHLQLQILSIQD